MCPRCLSLERHRLLWLFLTRELRLGQSPAVVLHFAPEPALRARLAALPALRYATADIRPGPAHLAADLEALPFPSGSCDLILCSHVLEHVPRDDKALRELFRVLRPGGLALLQVPLRLGATDEDPSVLDPGERRRRFGQEDHVRLYGEDFAARAEAAGFRVRREDYLAALDPAEAERCRVSSGETEPLFLARKENA
jgi:SAM-dependent methyltransferase